MPIHDAYARITPYELLLPEEGFDDRRFPLIREEARQREADLADPDRFPLLSEAGAILRELRGEGDRPELIHQFGALLYHAYHFWSQGMLCLYLATETARHLVETGPRAGVWAPVLPGRAGYLQLPQHLFLVPGPAGVPAESVDGFFWSAPDGVNLSILLAMGIRKERPGLSVVPLPVLPVSAAGEWASTQVRPEGGDFHSALPGSELEGLYSFQAGAEAVKLAMRVFWYLDTFPASVREGPGSLDAGDGPRPSRLEFRRIVPRAG